MSNPIAIAYIPVLHKGYVDFLNELQKEGVTELLLIGDSILETHEELDYINRKDRLRAVPVQMMQETLERVTKLSVRILETSNVEAIEADVIITPREDIGEVVVQHYFKDKAVDFRDVFLRRNKDNIGEEKTPKTSSVGLGEFETKLWNDVFAEAKKSTDWWRQVGAALVKDGEVLFVTHNEHMPEEQLPNIEGDARGLFKKGIHINYVTAAHAEVVAIAEAAKRGIVTEGAELYVTDFPCPYCARLIASAGIQKVYYIKGYAILDGDDFLKEEGVEVVRVKI